MRSRGSTTSLLFLNVSPGSLRAASWISSNKLPQPKHYATESSKRDGSKTPWIHFITLELSSWIHKSTARPGPQPTQSSQGGTNRWVHYTALGLWRDASQDQIKLSKKHHLDVSQDPSSLQTFRKVTEAYAVVGKKKTRRKYDQYEQLHWDNRPHLHCGSSMFYRSPPVYWTVMNKIMRDREKGGLNAREVSSSPQRVTTSHDRTGGNETRKVRTEGKDVFIIVAAEVFVVMWEGQEWILGSYNCEIESSTRQDL
ncbi:hypothetical protein DFH29DRAFT_922828, partial [Suillus ampliporus]